MTKDRKLGIGSIIPLLMNNNKKRGCKKTPIEKNRPDREV